VPTLSTEAARKEARREMAKSRRRGDYLTCDGGSATMTVDGKLMRSSPSEAEKKAEADRWWLLSCGPW
jgi:hypothetical protein